MGLRKTLRESPACRGMFRINVQPSLQSSLLINLQTSRRRNKLFPASLCSYGLNLLPLFLLHGVDPQVWIWIDGVDATPFPSGISRNQIFHSAQQAGNRLQSSFKGCQSMTEVLNECHEPLRGHNTPTRLPQEQDSLTCKR